MSDIDQRPGRKRALLGAIAGNGLLVPISFFVVLIMLLYAFQPSVLTTNQFQYVVLNSSIALAVSAAGLSLVVLVGGLDLSSAGVIALVNAFLATQLGGPPARQVLLIAAAIAIGAAVGLLNGLITVAFQLEPVVVTLGTGFVLGGLALLILPVPVGLAQDATGIVGWFTGTIGPVPVTGLLLILIVTGWISFRRSRSGASLMAVGGDPEAARHLGIDVRRTKVLAFTGAGTLYALAGITLTSQTSGGDPSVGASYLLGSFAAVVIGGLRLGGGRGSIAGAILGAMSLTVAVSVLFVLGVSSFWTFIARGMLLLLAVGAQALALSGARRWTSDAPPINLSTQSTEPF